jgi:CheY-like chemotaxis protein
MAVLGSLELLAKRLPDDPKSRMLLDNAKQAAERGATLTRRLLAFARMQNVQLRPVDIPALVRDMADLLHQSARDTIKIETQFPLTMKPALADANEIEMALLNLVVNARDAMENGGTIVISSRLANIARDEPHGLKAGEYVVLSVRDSGHGMDAETLRRATEPFFTTKGVGKGTGLGLAMVHGVAAQAGGRLQLISAPRKGTTAELWLPVAKQQAAEQPAPEHRAAETQYYRRLVILAVDDDPLVLLNTVAMLEDLGHGVIPARSGQEALQRAAADDSIELVITDQVMPEMTGTELIGLLRQQKPSLHFILASGYAELDKSATRDVHRLAKPFTQIELAAAVAPFARDGGDNVRRLPPRQMRER